MTPEMIVSLSGVLIALLFGYFPALRTWFAGMTSEAKSGIMIGLMVLVAFGVWGAGCINWITTGMVCTTAAIPDLLKLILLAIVSNQGVNRIVPELPDVKAAKQMRVAQPPNPEAQG